MLAFTNIRWELSSVQYNTGMSSNISPENWSQYRTTDWFKHITWELKLQYFRPVQTYYLKTDYSTVQQTGSNILAENWLQYSTTDRFKHITWELTTVQHSDRFKLSRLLKSNVDLKRRILSLSLNSFLAQKDKDVFIILKCYHANEKNIPHIEIYIFLKYSNLCL